MARGEKWVKDSGLAMRPDDEREREIEYWFVLFGGIMGTEIRFEYRKMITV